MARDEAVREAAAVWAVRVGDPAFEDWDGFTAWLEQDPSHARAYDVVALAAIEAAGSLPPIPIAENDDQPVRVSRRRWAGGALTLVLAGLTAFGAWQLGSGGRYSVETAPGEVQLIELEGGGQVAVAGASRVVFDRDDPRFASVEQGQALFTLEHDGNAPFTVAVGGDRIVDIGTVFDVTHTGGRLRVAVSEGAVVLNPERQNATVRPGQSLTKVVGEGGYAIGEVPLAAVGEWREGRLTFQDATLAEVAADLSRATGTSFAASARAPDQRISGSLTLEAVRRDPRIVGDLLGVTIRHDGAAWEIGAP